MIFIFILVSNEALLAEGYKVGVIAPLSGSLADYGVSIQRSIEVAKIRHPELVSGIKFIFEDPAYDPVRAVQAFRKLKDQDQVDLIYTWGVSFCKALSPLAESNKMPTVGQCIDEDSGKGKRYFIRFQNFSGQYMQKQSETLLLQKKRRLALIVAELAYQEGLAKGFQASLSPDQELVLVEHLPMNELDLRSIILKLKRANVDAVGVFLHAGQISTFFKQANVLGLDTHFFGTNLFESTSEILAANGKMDGATFIGHDIAPWFEEVLERRYGPTTQLSFGALAYDFTIHLGNSLSGTSSKLSGLDLIDHFTAKRSGFGEAAGAYSFAELPEIGRFYQFNLVPKEVYGTQLKTLSLKP